MLESSATASPSATIAAAARAIARFAVRVEAEADVERELRLPALQRAHAAAHASDEAPAGKVREVAAHGDLGDGELPGQLGDADAVPRVEQRKHALHPLGGGETRLHRLARSRRHKGRAYEYFRKLSTQLSKEDASKATDAGPGRPWRDGVAASRSSQYALGAEIVPRSAASRSVCPAARKASIGSGSRSSCPRR